MALFNLEETYIRVISVGINTCGQFPAYQHAYRPMSFAAGAPDPCLSAILLVVQSRSGSGSRICFHYPPDPLHPNEANPKLGSGTAGIFDESSTSSDDDDDESSSESETPVPSRRGVKPEVWQGHRSWTGLADEDEDDMPSRGGNGHRDRSWEPSWEPLLGFGTDGLVGLLTPDRTWHKRKFEVGINDFCFVGWPVFAKEDGTWKKQRTNRSGARDDQDIANQEDTSAVDSETGNCEDGAAKAQSTVQETVGELKIKKSEMTMFNIVFVLEPPILEDSVRVKEMYDHVVKKFTRALKWEQGRSEYVWHQAELIQSITSKHYSQESPASAMYAELLSRSSLATAISTVYSYISTSRIASVTLSPNVTISLQIPPITSISELPSLTEPAAQPGLWITTANDPPESSNLDTTSQSGSLQLAKQYTLLLKSTKQRILKDVQSTGGPLAAPMSNFVVASNPTKSFYKISVASKISLADIQLLSRHLIDWRRAVAIPPLNQRDTYIVSPNADMSQLKAASKDYEAAFPTLPSLPKMLSTISEVPKPWGFLIPSSDHKATYYEVLAWLMRGGWVTQLRTFARVRVSPEIKKVVREKEVEEKKKVKQEASAPADDEGKDESASRARRPSIVSRPSSDARQSITTNSTMTSSTQNSSQKFADNPNISSLIQNPNRASPLESTWLDYIADSLLTTDYALSGEPLSDTEKAELRRYWPKFVKYFNGEEALENIPVREGMKRAVVWDMLGKMGLNLEAGTEMEDAAAKRGTKWLITYRHW